MKIRSISQRTDIEAYGKLTDDIEKSLDAADKQAESTTEKLTHNQMFDNLKKTASANFKNTKLHFSS